MASGEGSSYRNSKVQETTDEKSPVDIGLLSRNGMFVLGNTDAVCKDESTKSLKEKDGQVLIFEEIG